MTTKWRFQFSSHRLKDILGKKKDLEIFRFRISIMGLRDSIRGHEGTADDTDDTRAVPFCVC